MDVTRLINEIGAAGVSPTHALTDPRTDQLLEIVYKQLRASAQQLMNNERPGHTLSATALVHEAYAKLVGSGPATWQGRAQFLAAAAEAMRRILVDHARGRARIKRGGVDGKAPVRVPLHVLEAAHQAEPEIILALDDALRRLETEEPDVAGVVRLRFFAGLSGDEAANALGISPRQVDRLWAYGRARLLRWMEEAK